MCLQDRIPSSFRVRMSTSTIVLARGTVHVGMYRFSSDWSSCASPHRRCPFPVGIPTPLKRAPFTRRDLPRLSFLLQDPRFFPIQGVDYPPLGLCPNYVCVACVPVVIIHPPWIHRFAPRGSLSFLLPPQTLWFSPGKEGERLREGES